MILKFESLDSGLKTLLGVFDKSIPSDSRVIYLNEGYLIAKSALILCKVKVDYEGEFENTAVKYDYLANLISGFSNLSYTQVEDVSWVLEGNKINVSIQEIPKEEDYADFGRTSHFELDNQVTPEALAKQFAIQEGENISTIFSADIQKYFSTLYPLITSATTGSQTKLSFADDYVFYISNVFQSFVKNDLPDSMKGIELKNSSVFLLKSLFDKVESLEVGRRGNELIVMSIDNSLECAIRVDNLTFVHKKFLDNFNKDTAVSIDRLYVKEVLRRISSFGGDANVYFNDDVMTIENRQYEQELPLLQHKGELSDISFKLNTSILDKMFLGTDLEMPKSSFFYMIPKGKGITLYISDDSGEWFSTGSMVAASAQ